MNILVLYSNKRKDMTKLCNGIRSMTMGTNYESKFFHAEDITPDIDIEFSDGQNIIIASDKTLMMPLDVLLSKLRFRYGNHAVGCKAILITPAAGMQDLPDNEYTKRIRKQAEKEERAYKKAMYIADELHLMKSVYTHVGEMRQQESTVIMTYIKVQTVLQEPKLETDRVVAKIRASYTESAYSLYRVHMYDPCNSLIPEDVKLNATRIIAFNNITGEQYYASRSRIKRIMIKYIQDFMVCNNLSAEAVTGMMPYFDEYVDEIYWILKTRGNIDDVYMKREGNAVVFVDNVMSYDKSGSILYVARNEKNKYMSSDVSDIMRHNGVDIPKCRINKNANHDEHRGLTKEQRRIAQEIKSMFGDNCIFEFILGAAIVPGGVSGKIINIKGYERHFNVIKSILQSIIHCCEEEEELESTLCPYANVFLDINGRFGDQMRDLVTRTWFGDLMNKAIIRFNVKDDIKSDYEFEIPEDYGDRAVQAYHEMNAKMSDKSKRMIIDHLAYHAIRDKISHGFAIEDI